MLYIRHNKLIILQAKFNEILYETRHVPDYKDYVSKGLYCKDCMHKTLSCGLKVLLWIDNSDRRDTVVQFTERSCSVEIEGQNDDFDIIITDAVWNKTDSRAMTFYGFEDIVEQNTTSEFYHRPILADEVYHSMFVGKAFILSTKSRKKHEFFTEILETFGAT